MASSSASTDSEAFNSAISSSRLFGPGHSERVGAPFREVGAALEHLELREGILGPVAVQQLAGAAAGDRALEPGGDRILPSARLAQLPLQLGDVGFVGLEGILDHLELFAQASAHVGGLLALDQRRLGEVLAILRKRQLGLFGPVSLKLVEAGERAPHFLSVGDAARGRGANLDQRLFHLEDHHSDHFRRVFRPVEHLGDVRRENVPCPGKNTHSITPVCTIRALYLHFTIQDPCQTLEKSLTCGNLPF